MKTCPNPKCKATSIPDDAMFCPKCGSKFVDVRSKNNVKALILCLFIGVGIFLGVYISVKFYFNPKIHRECEERDPSGFIVNTGEEWGEQEYYQTRDEDRSQSTLFFYSWKYDKFVYVNFFIDENNVNGRLTGYVNYNNQPSNIHHDYKLIGTANGKIWKFEALDNNGKCIDHYEVQWSCYDFTGTCTNKNGTKIKFKAIRQNTLNSEYF